MSQERSEQPTGKRLRDVQRSVVGNAFLNTLVITLPTRQLTWLARLFLRLGPDAEVLEPAALRAEIETQAKATLARYQG